jgi:hypothetical protein
MRLFALALTIDVALRMGGIVEDLLRTEETTYLNGSVLH